MLSTRIPVAPAALLLLAACGIGEVRVNGVVTRNPDPKARPLEGAEVAILDDKGNEFDSTTTNASGGFSAAAPPGTTIFAQITNGDDVTASFTGISGLQPTLQVPRGNLWGVPQSLLDDWRTTFAGCPEIDQGGLVIGQVRIYFYADADGNGINDYLPEDLPIVTTATARLEDPTSGSTDEHTVCYLDADTGLYDPEAEVTGDLGWFAIGGVDSGERILVIEYEIADGVFERAFLTVWTPPSGVVARIPTYVEFPLF